MTETLPGFEPSEEDMYQMAISQPLEKKIKNAIGLLQSICADKKVCVAFSGGKDSIVIKRLAQMAGIDFDAIYSVTTIDPPELVRYIKKYHPDTIWRRQPKAMLTRLVDRSDGPPTRVSRWCCDEYKENTGNEYSIKVIGVRAEESARRRGLWKQVNANRKMCGGSIVCPIVYWTDDDVWTFIRAENIPYCELYDQGFHRLGCVGCPLAGPRAQQRGFERWPGFERVWKRAIYRFYDKWHGVPKRDGTPRYFEDFGSAEGLWQWWISGKAFNPNEQQLEMDFDESDDADCQSRYYTR